MLNCAQIIGRVGQDPTTRYMPSGEAFTSLSVATSESWKDKQTGEKKEITEWHKVSFFGKLAEIAGQYLQKGSLVYVQGKITTRKYTDGQGIERYSTEIRAETMKMLGGRENTQNGERSANTHAQQRQAAPQRPQAPAAEQSGFDDMDSDIPF